MMTKELYKHWYWEQDLDGVVWLNFDHAENTVNTINREVLFELDIILDQVKNLLKPQALIIRTSKNGSFCVGADLQQLIDGQTDIKDLIEYGQKVFIKLEHLPVVTIAFIEGYCFGGGLELALACDYRIAINNDNTKFSLPEILLGLHPGWGGTIRLPKLIGVFSAMQLMLTGKAISVKKAKEIGLINMLIPISHKISAIKACLQLLTDKKTTKFTMNKFWQIDFIRPLIGKFLKYQLTKKNINKHYPARFRVIDNWINYRLSDRLAFTQEANSFCKLLETVTVKNLLRGFFLKEKLKKLTKQNTGAIKFVHVIGAGIMGGDIAAWCVLNGLEVTLEDININAVATALARANKIFKRHLLQQHLISAAQNSLNPDPQGFGRQKADIVIEAVIEDIATKQQLFLALEKQVKKEAILATNTSTITLEQLSNGLGQPERLIGLHFFNPVEKMALVEVVTQECTAEQIIKSSLGFIGQIKKLPLVVKSSPGFLINRLLIPYILESLILLEENISPATIDRIAVDFGMPVGPIELIDAIGLDVCKNVILNLNQPVPKILQELIKQGKTGKKTKAGFYRYDSNSKPIKAKAEANAAIAHDLTDRLIMRIISEAVIVVREKIIDDPELIDIGMILATGFAPYTGGPLHYMHSYAKEELSKKFNELSARYGSRFAYDN